MNIQHPEITWLERTGYTSYNQPKAYQLKTYKCQVCGCELEYDEVYDDGYYHFLCVDCLIEVNKKDWSDYYEEW